MLNLVCVWWCMCFRNRVYKCAVVRCTRIACDIVAVCLWWWCPGKCVVNCNWVQSVLFVIVVMGIVFCSLFSNLYTCVCWHVLFYLHTVIVVRSCLMMCAGGHGGWVAQSIWAGHHRLRLPSCKPALSDALESVLHVFLTV